MRVDEAQRLRRVLHEAVARVRGEIQLEACTGKQPIAPYGAVLDDPYAQGQRIAQTPGIGQSLATVDCQKQRLELEIR